MATGLVPVSTGVHVPWTTPIFIGGMLVNSIAGGILPLVNLAIVVVIWIPFLSILDKQYFRSEVTIPASKEKK